MQIELWQWLIIDKWSIHLLISFLSHNNDKYLRGSLNKIAYDTVKVKPGCSLTKKALLTEPLSHQFCIFEDEKKKQILKNILLISSRE